MACRRGKGGHSTFPTLQEEEKEACSGGDGCARSAGGRAAVCGAPAGRVPVLGRFLIIAVHRAFVLGLGARHRGIVELSEGG